MSYRGLLNIGEQTAPEPPSLQEQLDAGAGIVLAEEALDILDRFNASHWRGRMPAGTEEARYSIPANPKRDDDIRLGAFIRRAAKVEALAKRMRAVIDWECPPGQEDELDAIDRELAGLGLGR